MHNVCDRVGTAHQLLRAIEERIQAASIAAERAQQKKSEVEAKAEEIKKTLKVIYLWAVS